LQGNEARGSILAADGALDTHCAAVVSSDVNRTADCFLLIKRGVREPSAHVAMTNVLSVWSAGTNE